MDNDDSFNFQATWNIVKRLADAISHPALAVAELIKNAYDADASEVLINMKEAMGSNLENCRMVVSDNGHGMTKKDLQTKWSNIGVSVNTSEPFSRKGRSRQGGKGLGRFGAWKLGQKVTIATRSKNNPIYALTIDFSQHSPETPLEEVMSPILTDPPAFRNMFPDGATGTYIYVEKFNETMTKVSDLQLIQRNTQTLLNPFEPQSDFNIILQLPKKFEKWEDFDFQQITSQALYKFEVAIDPRGQSIEGTYVNNNPYSKFYEEQERVHIATTDLLGGEKCQIGAVKVWIYHFSKASGYKKLWPTTNLGLLSKEDYNERICGFRLYKDGVRVFPYGEPGNDWLQLDYMQNRQRSVDWFSNTQIVAAARFDMNTNKGTIVDKSNREGLEETKGKKQLFNILQQLVKIMRAKVNKDYPSEQPSHLKAPNFDYGSFSLTVGQDVNMIVRNTGGDITKNYSVTKGKLPKGMSLDTRTGTVSGAPLTSSLNEVEIEITAGNNQGNHTATLIISEINDAPAPAPIGGTTGVNQGKGWTAPTSPENSGTQPPMKPTNISDLDRSISQFANKVNRLPNVQQISQKKKLLEDLKKHIDEILEHEDFFSP
ncbi:ATP-binding protein [Candidatus Poseidonia alphae]|nr:ATP-binding protein [Candidatus Poseidonia alphae]